MDDVHIHCGDRGSLYDRGKAANQDKLDVCCYKAFKQCAQVRV